MAWVRDFAELAVVGLRAGEDWLGMRGCWVLIAIAVAAVAAVAVVAVAVAFVVVASVVAGILAAGSSIVVCPCYSKPTGRG